MFAFVLTITDYTIKISFTLSTIELLDLFYNSLLSQSLLQQFFQSQAAFFRLILIVLLILVPKVKSEVAKPKIK